MRPKPRRGLKRHDGGEAVRSRKDQQRAARSKLGRHHHARERRRHTPGRTSWSRPTTGRERRPNVGSYATTAGQAISEQASRIRSAPALQTDVARRSALQADRWYHRAALPGTRDHQQWADPRRSSVHLQCGHTGDRDLNAAVNLARWGHTHHDPRRRPDPQVGGRDTNARRRDGADQHPSCAVKPARMKRDRRSLAPAVN